MRDSRWRTSVTGSTHTWLWLGVTLAACDSSSPVHELIIHGHGTVTVDGRVFVCDDDECHEEIALPHGPGQVDLWAEATDLDWVLTALSNDEDGQVAALAPTDRVGQGHSLEITTIEAVFERLEPCTLPTGLAGVPTLAPPPRVCVTADRVAISGEHLGVLDGPACVYLNTALAGTENRDGSSGEVTSLDVLLPGDVSGLATIVIRTEQGRALRSFARFDLPPPAPASIAPNPVQGNVVASLAGTNFFPDMLATLVGPETVGDIEVRGSGETSASLWIPALTPGDYQLTLRNVCGEGVMPGVLTVE